ncbi:MAG: RNA polymerase sigma factor [Planctomycetota bacterium]|jgi:RNA polymerase sigma-70 factor (ECF subfamily)
MIEEKAFTELVKLARQGHEESKSRLAGEAELRLRAYVFRVTLDYDLTQDLSQEALLEMIKSLDNLKDVERFWPWLYRLAQSKIQQYYRYKQKKAAISASVFYDDFLAQQADRHQDDGLRHLLREELSKTVMTAMKDVKQQYRAVLSLRCFDQLSYPDIALAMDCSEVKARVLFVRAKQALRNQLARRGLSKGLFVMALGLFGKVTAPAEAAGVTVVPASTKVGLSTAVLAAVSTKLGVATIAALVMGAATVGGVKLASKPSLPPLPPRPQVTSLRYTTQLRDNRPGALGSLSKGAYEQWYYFPDGVDGPVFTRMQRWTPRQDRRLCAWLQNGQANYYYHAVERQVYIHNYRVFWSNLSVRCLPTDSGEFTDFLSQAEGGPAGLRHTRDPRTGLLRGAIDYRFADAPRFRTNYEYNCLSEEEFGYDWPAEVPVVDRRDRMHVRGWTYFRIDGQIRGQTVSGRGRVPFVYDALQASRPWLVVDVGDGLRIVDSEEGACLCRSDGTSIASYPSGSFFKGLGRPWMGMHTIDIVRRDAAARRVWFETTPAGNDKDVIVTLRDKGGGGDTELVYTIDLENDLINVIEFRTGWRDEGSLRFTYLQDVEEAGSEFVEPALPEKIETAGQEPAMLWLIDLARGKLGT